ncbi:hypothetical protein, partial [Mycobacterium timonense]
MMDKLISYYGFSRMPFGRDLAPSTPSFIRRRRVGWPM